MQLRRDYITHCNLTHIGSHTATILHYFICPRTESSYFGQADLRTNRALFLDLSAPRIRSFSSSRLVNNSLSTRKIPDLPRPHGNSARSGSLGGNTFLHSYIPTLLHYLTALLLHNKVRSHIPTLLHSYITSLLHYLTIL